MTHCLNKINYVMLSNKEFKFVTSDIEYASDKVYFNHYLLCISSRDFSVQALSTLSILPPISYPFKFLIALSAVS